MAAAIAASLPAPQSAPAPAAPTYEAIPASMAKVIDIEADIPVTSVQLDGLVSLYPIRMELRDRISKDCFQMNEKTQRANPYTLIGIGCFQNCQALS